MLTDWWPVIPAEDRRELTADIRRLGYKRVEELVRWRTLPADGRQTDGRLGSHQLDACSIFLGKVLDRSRSSPPAASTFTRTIARPRIMSIASTNFPGRITSRTTTTSSRLPTHPISTNGFEPYGECVMGSKGTLVVEGKQNATLWGIQGCSTEVTANTTVLGPCWMRRLRQVPPGTAGAAVGQNAIGFNPPSKGYREELRCRPGRRGTHRREWPGLRVLPGVSDAQLCTSRRWELAVPACKLERRELLSTAS